MVRGWTGAIAAIVCIIGAPETAQAALAGQCRIPETLPTPRAEGPERAQDIRKMPIGGYTLAMIWMPQQCNGSRRQDMQCDKRIGRIGFVVHGLWPDGMGRTWPQYCSSASLVPKDVLIANFCTTPSVQLMQHEWTKHGTCMSAKPSDYFDRSRALFHRMRFPDMRRLAREKGLTARRLAEAVARVNPGISARMIRIHTGRGGMLSELWLCLDTAFRPQRCPATKSGFAGNTPVRIRTSY